MSSRGSWPYYYTSGLDRRNDPQGRDAHGIYAFKAELVLNGFGVDKINQTLAYWGAEAVRATKHAQVSFGINPDGVLGPQTARCLWRKRVSEAEVANSLPAHLLARIKTLESGDDPVAQGFSDPEDEGLFQENLPSNPDLTQVQCWTPSFIVPHAASQLKARIKACAGSVKAGAAAWNVGDFYANQWREAGFPASGGDNDVYERATHYVALVNAEPV